MKVKWENHGDARPGASHAWSAQCLFTSSLFPLPDAYFLSSCGL